MLKISDTLEFTHSVKVQVPVDGGHLAQEFKARFRAVDTSEIDTKTPEEQLRAVWIGWEGIANDDGSEIPFSDAARDRLIGMPFVRLPLLRAYAEAIIGGKRGN